MSDYIIIQKSDLAADSFKNDNTNGKGGIKIAVSPDKGNLLQHRKNGIYYGVEAPADTSNMYVSTSQGDDSNTGTKNAPLRTIREALRRNSANQKFTINLKEDETFEWRSSWGDFGNYAFTVQPYGPQWDNIRANNAPNTVQYLRSNNGLRPTIKFIVDATFQVGGTTHALVRTVSYATQTTGQYPITFNYCALDWSERPSTDPNSFIGNAWFGSHASGVYMQLVGCILKPSAVSPLVAAGSPSWLRADACALDTSVGNKVINIHATGALSFALTSTSQHEGDAIQYSKGLTFMGTSSVEEWKAVIEGNRGVTTGNITTNQPSLGA